MTGPQPSSAHFEDFAPEVTGGPPPTYPDDWQTVGARTGRWFWSVAGLLWTDDERRLGLEASNALDFDRVAQVRRALAAQFTLGRPAGEVYNRLFGEFNPDEWFSGPLDLLEQELES